MKFLLHTVRYAPDNEAEKAVYAEMGFKTKTIDGVEIYDAGFDPEVELSSLDELMAFSKKCGCDLVVGTFFGKNRICLYDDYME